MEEEYRMQKAQGEITPLASTSTVNGRDGSAGTVIHEDGTVVTRNSVISDSTTLADPSADDDASIRGVSSTSAIDLSSTNGSSTNAAAGIPIPIIRISTESDRDMKPEDAELEPSVNGGAKQNGVKDAGDAVEKPVQAADAGEGAQETSTPSTAPEPFSFSNKRLCERWLDNLFMVLYEVGVFLLMTLELAEKWVSGFASVDDIQSRSCSFQNAACSISQDGSRVGDSWRPWFTPTS